MSGPGQAPPGPARVLLGVDVGGSRTRAAVATEELTAVGRAEGPGAPMRPGGGRRTAAVIGDVARRAAAKVGLTLPASAAVIGAAGAGNHDEQIDLANAVQEAGLAHRVRVYPDAEVALAAAFGDTPGILLNAGTGTIAFARDPHGRLRRSGGYGWQMGDEGSGYWLGRHALQAAGRTFDGREESSTLLARLLGALGLGTFDDLVRWSVAATPAQVAALAPQLLHAARDGEAVAQRALVAAAEQLTELVARLERHFPGTDPVPVVTMGSLLEQDSPLATALTTELRRKLPRIQLRDLVVDAPHGALTLARSVLTEP